MICHIKCNDVVLKKKYWQSDVTNFMQKHRAQSFTQWQHLFHTETTSADISAFQREDLLTPRSRDPPEKLTGPQLLKKFTAFYGTRRFITAFIKARYLSLS
jgi:hypothetical protein